MRKHGYIAINGQCVSLDKLISTQSISMTRTGRDGYSYEIECSGNGFTATARHRPAPADSPSTILISPSTPPWNSTKSSNASAKHLQFPRFTTIASGPAEFAGTSWKCS